MKDWELLALAALERSLKPLPHERNEIDWKSSLSSKTERLKEHLSAFSNYEGGGFIAFGINNDGLVEGLTERKDEIVKKLGNIAREGLEPKISIEHSILEYNTRPILIVKVPQSRERPVHLRGKSVFESYTRVAGQTRRLSKAEVGTLISLSSGVDFEDQIALDQLAVEQITGLLDIQAYFELLSLGLPSTSSAIVDALISDGIVTHINDNYAITNLGALLFAKNVDNFDNLSRKSVRVILYDSDDRRNTIKEQIWQRGYASGFEGLVSYVNDQLPTNEVIEKALRRQVKLYPELAIRELIANALIHQDFSISGSGPMIEVFTDRVELTNPGRPLINTLRFIDSPPRSRNEKIASLMRRLNICEERGSGIDKVIFEVEFHQLPAPDFIEAEENLKVILYAPKLFREMDKADRVRACYQHACIQSVSRKTMTNESLRKRFNIADSNYPMATRVINDTLDAGWIKLADPENPSRKYRSYLPFWA